MLNLQRRVSRKGESYARFHLEDPSGRLEMLVFPSAYRNNLQQLQEDQPVVVEGFYDTRDEEPKLAVRRIFHYPKNYPSCTCVFLMMRKKGMVRKDCSRH